MLVDWIIGGLVTLVIASLVIGGLTHNKTFYWIATAAGVVLVGLFLLVAVALTAL